MRFDNTRVNGIEMSGTFHTPAGEKTKQATMSSTNQYECTFTWRKRSSSIMETCSYIGEMCILVNREQSPMTKWFIRNERLVIEFTDRNVTVRRVWKKIKQV